MRIPRILATLTLLKLSSLHIVNAWGAAGHEIVATIAQIYLHPSALSAVCDIINPEPGLPCHLSSIATWADRVRRQPEYRYSASLHYIGSLGDHPSTTCLFPGDRGWAGHRDENVLGAVRNVTGVLVDYLDGLRDANSGDEALKFLVHFVGDMHMPLHLTGRDRGGNGDKVTFDGRVTNLHSLWDGLLIAQALRTIPANYTRALPATEVEQHLRGTIYDPYVRRIMYEGFGVSSSSNAGRFTGVYLDWLDCPSVEPSSAQAPLRSMGDEARWDDDVLCPYAWAKEIHSLNCDLPVWPAELGIVSSEASDDEHDCMDGETELGRRPQPHPDLLELDTPEYSGRIRDGWVVERLLAMAGVRLAGILNGIFVEDADFDTSLRSGHVNLPIIKIRT